MLYRKYLYGILSAVGIKTGLLTPLGGSCKFRVLRRCVDKGSVPQDPYVFHGTCETTQMWADVDFGSELEKP